MREIKFRAWDVLNKKILNWGEVFHLPAWEIFPGTPEQRAFEVMQYTGLKDRNGKEIYEGDIVKFKTLTPNFTKSKDYTIRAISYDVSALCYVADVYSFIGGPYSALTETVEVLGNIYENPELFAKVVG